MKTFLNIFHRRSGRRWKMQIFPVCTQNATSSLPHLRPPCFTTPRSGHSHNAHSCVNTYVTYSGGCPVSQPLPMYSMAAATGDRSGTGVQIESGPELATASDCLGIPSCGISQAAGAIADLISADGAALVRAEHLGETPKKKAIALVPDQPVKNALFLVKKKLISSRHRSWAYLLPL